MRPRDVGRELRDLEKLIKDAREIIYLIKDHIDPKRCAEWLARCEKLLKNSETLLKSGGTLPK